MSAPLQSVLHPAGADAAVISQFAWVLFGIGALIFVAVMVLVLLSVRRQERPVRPALWIAGAGVAFPVVVLTALLGWSTWRSAQLVPQTSHKAMTVSVTAKMWWWEVRYRDPRTGREIVTANEIHIPVGTPVYLGLNAADVIHSLWVPNLAGKRDMIPGRVTGLTLRADKPGVYRGQCAEYCGAQHARMALHVVASTPEEFDAWLARQAEPAKAPDTPELALGRAAFLEQRCQACHTIRGVADGSRLGPDLTHVGSRMQIGAGTLRTHRGALAGWIADPQAIKPGVFMPASQDLDGESLRALAAYLEHLK
ncbi:MULTISPECIES: cytochrome c oxidase subunit II [unclassified Massilia]|uniref:cytochrome c oxidase subunit II n=1 Tax=unclassified Massilia TaxID=2609279 RepID=UPI001B8141B9|nr:MULTISPECIES: cytochrome c oxidase subunit II [unclassified Massilia]MBQ5939877.1 cytochrome c oxidase subunit II [Massilia sp. AB1]MBQ5965203.1 cytochrome c oxidase subunit II [Massilia sp. ZL223]